MIDGWRVPASNSRCACSRARPGNAIGGTQDRPHGAHQARILAAATASPARAIAAPCENAKRSVLRPEPQSDPHGRSPFCPWALCWPSWYRWNASLTPVLEDYEASTSFAKR
jgi:hypothetical protein